MSAIYICENCGKEYRRDTPISRCLICGANCNPVPQLPTDLFSKQPTSASSALSNFSNTIQDLKRKSQAGDIIAMKQAGDMLYHGSTGNAKNFKDALPFYRMAADRGDIDSAGKVAVALLNGLAGTTDAVTGMKYAVKVANAGDVNMQFAVGMNYEVGLGCQKNRNLAIKYYRMAALQNHAEAQFRLFYVMYTEKPQYDEFLHWLCCAYLNGWQEAISVMKDFYCDYSALIDNTIQIIQTHGIIPQTSSSGSNNASSGQTGGCYIATCVYGSYDCPEVWVLRRFRDYHLAQTCVGRAFIQTYYAISPHIVRLFGKSNSFQRFWRSRLNRVVIKLRAEGISDQPYSDC